ncbi:MAG: tRNA (adenosine(37)-N6)-dimethylallyltransferase MiaA [Oligoflexia bacterium]|nr:tRNA (adenosine(37)-N6)-dimethylallyltransferase MiaA [Oligoflexia bacterium]
MNLQNKNISLNKNKIIVISGPTATYKTKIGIMLAKHLKNDLKCDVNIINFDSLLFYKELSIGTAKPTEREKEGIIHHLMSIRSIREPMNAHDFVKIAEETICKLQKINIIPILIGGSGFYLRALISGMYDSPTTPEKIINRSNKLFAKHGIKPFWDLLKRVDVESYNTLHFNDHYRIRRAIEHYWTTNFKFSSEKKKFESVLPAEIESNGNGESRNSRFGKIIHIHLDVPKEEHDKIIRKRIYLMMDNGFEEEVKLLLNNSNNVKDSTNDNDFTGEEKPLKSVGYKEMVAFLRGEIKSKDECIEKIFLSTRHLAKAQRTWFKKVKDKMTCNPLDSEDIEKIKIVIKNAFV